MQAIRASIAYSIRTVEGFIDLVFIGIYLILIHNSCGIRGKIRVDRSLADYPGFRSSKSLLCT